GIFGAVTRRCSFSFIFSWLIICCPASLCQWFDHILVILIDFLAYRMQMLLLRTPISGSKKMLSRLDMQIVFGAIQFPSVDGNSRGEPSLIGCFVFRETRVTIYPK